MSKLLYNILKISGGGQMPQMPPHHRLRAWLQEIEARVQQRLRMAVEGTSWTQALCAEELYAVDKGMNGGGWYSTVLGVPA